ncbi:hypothetical protein Pelo_3554 [Pelomyxa schiedti]|nr:hypothetical protein Pelo_3554 [Pelomyxa schiedti]
MPTSTHSVAVNAMILIRTPHDLRPRALRRRTTTLNARPRRWPIMTDTPTSRGRRPTITRAARPRRPLRLIITTVMSTHLWTTTGLLPIIPMAAGSMSMSMSITTTVSTTATTTKIMGGRGIWPVMTTTAGETPAITTTSTSMMCPLTIQAAEKAAGTTATVVVHGHSHESSDGGHVSEGISLKLSGSRDDEAHGHYGDHHSSHSSGSAAHSPSRGHTDSHASSSSHHSSSRTSEKYARVKKENKALGLICRFTPEQMTDFNNAFRKTGKRYDGELNLAEFRSILHLVLPVEEITDQDTKTLFELMDVDYSGGVSFKEFCLWSSIFTGASTSQDKSAWLDVMFTMLDTDDSGTLDADEIAIGYMRVVKGTTMLAGGSADSEELQATSAHITDAVNNHFKGRKKISKPEFMKFWEALTGE